MKKLFLNLVQLLFILSFSESRDLYVSKGHNYETDSCLLFDEFNDTLDTPGRYANAKHAQYYPACDAVDLGENGPILGTNFTQEAWISRARDNFLNGKKLQLIMGYNHVDAIGSDGDSPARAAALPAGGGSAVSNPNCSSNCQEAPNIKLYWSKGIVYGFGAGDSRIVVEVDDSLITSSRTWYHIATTFDGTDYKLFVNGEEVYNYEGAAGKTPYPQPVRFIGASQEGARYPFIGKIDEVRMWSIARSQSEIQETMNKTLNGNETGLVAYYPMDAHNRTLFDRGPNGFHGRMRGPIIQPQYFSDNCPEPDGSMDCPYPNLESAVKDALPYDNILIRGGRYFESFTHLGLNWHSSKWNPPVPDPYENTITIEPYPNEEVILDATMPVELDWEPYDFNGHAVFRAYLDSTAIANAARRPFPRPWNLFVSGRYMIPALEVNMKNPIDPEENGGPFDDIPGTFWKKLIHNPGARGITPGTDLALLDTLEEWAYDTSTHFLYLYADERFLPTSTNVRIAPVREIMNFSHVSNLAIRNIDFFGGTARFSFSLNLVIENCNFTNCGINSGFGSGYGYNQTIRNCVFENFSGFPGMGGTYGLYENLLFRNIDWFANPGGGAPTINGYHAIARYVTYEGSLLGGTGGGSHLIEYCRYQDIIDRCDCGAINKGDHSAPNSMTRYNWIIGAIGANGMRIDGGAIGAGNRRGDVHNIVTIGNYRGMRLKGDFHEVYNITAYGNSRWDISLPTQKYAEPPPLGYGGAPGNRHTKLKNSLVEDAMECTSDNCWGFLPVGEIGYTNPTNADHLLKSGIWFGTALEQASVQAELADPWIQRRNLPKTHIIYTEWGYPWYDERTQNYDFRPRKGSSLIDAGVIIEGINDGQDMEFNWPPSYPGQNRKYVGDAPDIGAYEYGDSVYWIPGYRYPHPSFPIPRDNKMDVIPDYSLVWNYPYKRDYSSTSAIVTVNGPGVHRTETFDYPNNVLFQAFEPSGNYTWSVTVDGVSGGTWFFQVDDDIYPMNDRSIGSNINEMILVEGQNFLEVYNNNIAFLRFDVPPSIDDSWQVELNLHTRDVHSLTGGIVVHSYNVQGWTESNNESNIGLMDHTLGPALHTLTDLEPESPVVLDMNTIINDPGEYSFALAALDSNDHVNFYSFETDYHYYYMRPSLSFTPSIDSVEVVLSVPPDDSTIVLNSTSGDSILFEWDFSHDTDVDVLSYELQIGLPYPGNTRDLDTLFIAVNVTENNARISKQDLLDMLVEANLSEAVFVWDVTGTLATGEMVAVKSHSFSTVIDDPNYESTLPEKYWLYHNYPNPFNPATTISYDLKAWSRITLDVFDILGRNIMTLENGLKAPGRHHVQWFGKDTRGSQMSSGVYFYHLKVQDHITGKETYTHTEKMMIVK